MSTWQVFNMTIAILAVVLGVFNIYWRYKNDQRVKKEALKRAAEIQTSESKAQPKSPSLSTLY